MPVHITPDDPHFVYEMYDEAGTVLYIGCTGNLAQRLSSHRSERDWFGDVARLVVDRYPDQRSGLDEERARIIRLQPKYNHVFTESHDNGGWKKRRQRMDEAHGAGRFCGDHVCRPCIDQAHALGVACRNRTWLGTSCRVCANFKPFYTLLSDEDRKAHPDWEPLWEAYPDRCPTCDEAEAFFDTPLTPLTRRRSA